MSCDMMRAGTPYVRLSGVCSCRTGARVAPGAPPRLCHTGRVSRLITQCVNGSTLSDSTVIVCKFIARRRLPKERFAEPPPPRREGPTSSGKPHRRSLQSSSTQSGRGRHWTSRVANTSAGLTVLPV